MKPVYYVYILESRSGKLYVGYTSNLEKRMQAHQAGKGSKFIRAFGFGKLLYHETHDTKSGAMKREAMIKTWSREQKLVLIRTSA